MLSPSPLRAAFKLLFEAASPASRRQVVDVLIAAAPSQRQAEALRAAIIELLAEGCGGRVRGAGRQTASTYKIAAAGRRVMADGKYRAILLDCPWDPQPWSPKGKGPSPLGTL
jgi:hypothetical protein